MATTTPLRSHDPSSQPKAASRRLPSLEARNRLTSTEFLRRYEATPDVEKAELIEAIVYMPSAVSATKHGDPHFLLVTWLGVHQSETPGMIGSDNATSVLRQLRPSRQIQRLPPERGPRIPRLTDPRRGRRLVRHPRGPLRTPPPDAAGVLAGEVFPGLRLEPAALLRRDLSRVLTVLPEGLASPEHAAFVARLAASDR